MRTPAMWLSSRRGFRDESPPARMAFVISRCTAGARRSRSRRRVGRKQADLTADDGRNHPRLSKKRKGCGLQAAIIRSTRFTGYVRKTRFGHQNTPDARRRGYGEQWTQDTGRKWVHGPMAHLKDAREAFARDAAHCWFLPRPG